LFIRREKGMTTKSVRNTTLEFEDGEIYLIERDSKKNIFVNKELVLIKDVDDFTKEEKSTYDEAKEFGDKDYAMLKASLCYFFKDEEKFPDIQDDGVIFGVVDAIILRVLSNKQLRSSYFFNNSLWRIESDAEKFHSLPSCGSQLVVTDFDEIINLL
jgi:hypothetical protein